jgi:hypothetical protein
VRNISRIKKYFYFMPFWVISVHSVGSHILYAPSDPIRVKKVRKLKKEVPGWDNTSLSYIHHTLHKRLSLSSRPAAKKPLLTEVMKRKRLAFAKKYHHRTKKDIGEKTMKINNSRVGQPIVFFPDIW